MSSSAFDRTHLQRLLPGLLVLVALLALFYDTAADMVGIWMRSETFAHAFLVPPITAWLIWRKRAHLAQHQPRSVPWLLVPMALACLLWTLGELADVNAATQFVLVLLIVLSVPAVFGFAVAREITFPLLFLFFAVPLGEFLVAPMMEWTADFTVAAVSLSGVPVYREGLQFVIPSGSWSVVEACSGVRYLIASFMVGSLFAYLNYQSPTRRVVFMLASLAAPVVANWLRAYLIVMLGHLSDNKLAAGADHLVYGWVFFGIIIAIMFMIGARWAQPDSPQPLGSQSLGEDKGDRLGDRRTWLVAAGVVTLLVTTQALMTKLDKPTADAVGAVRLPAQLSGGWIARPAQSDAWVPLFRNPSVTAHEEYASEVGRFSVWVGYFRNQGQDSKLVSSANLLVEDHSTEWAVVSAGRAALDSSAPASHLSTAVLRQPADLKVEPRVRLQVAHLYWVDGHFTHRASEAKVRTALSRFLGRGDDGAVLVFTTELPATGTAAVDLNLLVADHLPAFGRALASTAASAARP